MPTKSEFEKANRIIHTVKSSAEGNLPIWDVLDICQISLSWWKEHKKWFLYRNPHMKVMEIEGMLYLVHNIEQEGKPNASMQKTL